jgi:glycosyltransferase involved in cell wall biosynthesis
VSALAGLSVVLACFNEEGNIERAVRSAADAAAGASDDYEVIVVDDGSDDRTLPLASELARRDPRVRVLVHAGTRGYGAAVRTGIDAARMPWILLTDAGLPVDPHELQGFLPVAAQADLVVGWRDPRGDSLARRIGAGARGLLVRHMFGLAVHDADCAFKLVRRDLVGRLPLTCDGAMIGTEIVVRALAAGGRVREVEVRRPPPGTPTRRRPRPRGHARRRLPAR